MDHLRDASGTGNRDDGFEDSEELLDTRASMEMEQAREEEARHERFLARHERFLAACQLRSVEAQGICASGVPDVGDAPEVLDPSHQQPEDTTESVPSSPEVSFSVPSSEPGSTPDGRPSTPSLQLPPGFGADQWPAGIGPNYIALTPAAPAGSPPPGHPDATGGAGAGGAPSDPALAGGVVPDEGRGTVQNGTGGGVDDVKAVGGAAVTGKGEEKAFGPVGGVRLGSPATPFGAYASQQSTPRFYAPNDAGAGAAASQQATPRFYAGTDMGGGAGAGAVPTAVIGNGAAGPAAGAAGAAAVVGQPAAAAAAGQPVAASMSPARSSDRLGYAPVAVAASGGRLSRERLGQSLQAGEKERRLGSGRLPSGQGPAPGGTGMLAPLAPDQQLVMEWSNVCSWVDTGGHGGQKHPIRDFFKPAVKGAQAVGKAGGAAGGAAKRLVGRGSAPPDVEMGAAQPVKPEQPASYRQILHNVTGRVLPGHVLALMGPSGSGKTSLLSILGGRCPAKLKLSGSVTVNGMRLTKATRRRLGFVLQDDVLFETLTVHETLTFAGLLRLPRTMTRAEKMERVEAVTAVLGLTKAKDTIIGGYFRRGVSGGERKRVSVGQELLINPSVLLLDEPTSGLDSTTALHLVKLLHDLAGGGRAILTTIHQPSSRLYSHLDQVLLLADGHMMYMGDGPRAVDWFEHLGFPLPYGTNLADHLLDCAMGEVQFNSNARGAPWGQAREGKERSMHGKTAVQSLYTTFENWYASHPEGLTLRPSSTTVTSTPTLHDSRQPLFHATSSALLEGLLSDVKLLPCARRSATIAPTAPTAATTPPAATATTAATEANGNGQHHTTAAAPKANGNGPHKTEVVVHPSSPAGVMVGSPGVKSKAGTPDVQGAQKATPKVDKDTPFFEQVEILWRRAIKVRRFESLSGQQFFQLIAVAVITGLLWWQRAANMDVEGAADVLGLLFFELVFVAFRSLFAALFTFPNEFRILSKERPSGNPKLSAYYVARTLADLPVEVLLPSIFIIIVYWFGGLRPTAGAFLSNWASVLLLVLTAQSWGLLIGGLFMDPKTAQMVTTVVMLSFMLVGGFYVRDVPVWIGWLKYLSFLYWGNSLLLKIQFMGQTLTNCAASLGAGPCPTIPPEEVQAALRLPIDPNESVWHEVVALLAMLGVLRYVTWHVLKWKISSSQKGL